MRTSKEGQWNAKTKLEVQRRYVDIHVPVTGVETLGYIHNEDNVSASSEAFNVKDDYALFVNAAMRRLLVEPDEFVAFFPPYGAHAPGMTDGLEGPIKKVVVKVKVFE